MSVPFTSHIIFSYIVYKAFCFTHRHFVCAMIFNYGYIIQIENFLSSKFSKILCHAKHGESFIIVTLLWFVACLQFYIQPSRVLEGSMTNSNLWMDTNLCVVATVLNCNLLNIGPLIKYFVKTKRYQ